MQFDRIRPVRERTVHPDRFRYPASDGCNGRPQESLTQALIWQRDDQSRRICTTATTDDNRHVGPFCDWPSSQ